jgi:hypothetical protein
MQSMYSPPSLAEWLRALTLSSNPGQYKNFLIKLFRSWIGMFEKEILESTLK